MLLQATESWSDALNTAPVSNKTVEETNTRKCRRRHYDHSSLHSRLHLALSPVVEQLRRRDKEQRRVGELL